MVSGEGGAESSSQALERQRLQDLEQLWLMGESLTEQLVAKAKQMESASGKEKKEAARGVVLDVGTRLVDFVNGKRARHPEIKRFDELLSTVHCTRATVDEKRTFEMQPEGQGMVDDAELIRTLMGKVKPTNGSDKGKRKEPEPDDEGGALPNSVEQLFHNGGVPVGNRAVGVEEAMRALKTLKISPDNNKEGVAAANALMNGKPMPHVTTATGAGTDRGPHPEQLFNFVRNPQDLVTEKDLEPSELIFKDGKFSQARNPKLSRAEGQFADTQVLERMGPSHAGREPFLSYLQTLAELYEIAPEHVVAKFDQKQRKGHAKGMFDTLEPTAVIMRFLMEHARFSFEAKDRHTLVRKPGSPPGSPLVHPKRVREREGVCRHFNSGDRRCTWGDRCKYKHVCSKCGGSHSAVKCTGKE